LGKILRFRRHPDAPLSAEELLRETLETVPWDKIEGIAMVVIGKDGGVDDGFSAGMLTKLSLCANVLNDRQMRWLRGEDD
jgi:hypothetical protein